MRLWGVSALILAIMAATWLAYTAGARSAATQAQQDAIDTIERAQDADVSTGDNDDDTDWLFQRGQR